MRPTELDRLGVLAGLEVLAESSSAATTQTLHITNCLGTVGNGGTFATGSDIVATMNWSRKAAVSLLSSAREHPVEVVFLVGR